MDVAGVRASARALAALVLVAVIGTACEMRADDPAALPQPAAAPSSVVPGQPPVVWVAGQVQELDGEQLVLVEPAGSRVVLQRLAEGATKFFMSQGERWTPMKPTDVELIEVGTQICAESLLDAGTYLALRVYVGAACGPEG